MLAIKKIENIDNNLLTTGRNPSIREKFYGVSTVIMSFLMYNYSYKLSMI